MRFSLSMGPLNEEVLLLLACHIDAHGMRFFLVQGKVREDSRENGFRTTVALYKLSNSLLQTL